MFTSVKKENILKEENNLFFFPIDLNLNYPIHGIYRRRLTYRREEDWRRREEDWWRREEDRRRRREENW